MSDSKDFSIAEEILRLRISQMIINEYYKRGAFQIPIHLAMGHEAIAVALDSIMSDEDSLVLPHRNIHYNLARARSLKPIIDEFLLSVDGLAHGELGSMNLANPKRGIVYTSSILGNNLSLATGLALAKKIRASDEVTIVVTGDGAMEEGTFYESLLFMKSFNLASLVIIENNGWSMHTSIPERRCAINVSAFAGSLDIPYAHLTGNDTYAYIDRLRSVRNSAIKSMSPVLVEVDLTTLGGWYTEVENNPKGRFIHPHAGPVPTVTENMRMPIENSVSDPLFVLKKYFTGDRLFEAEQAISADLHAEVETL